MMKRLFSTIAILWALVHPAAAHESRPAYLELTQTSSTTYDVLWKVPAVGNNMRLGLYLRFPENTEYVTEPRGTYSRGAYFESWSIRHPDALVGSTLSIDGLKVMLSDVLVRIERLDGTTQVALLSPANLFVTVEASPSRWQVARTYFSLGGEHILLGVDHLLFVLGLLLLVDRRWTLIKTITAFTVAHSITLALSVFAIIQVPAAPLNACIALSILFLGPEIVRKWRGETSLTIRQPWVVAFAFGLLHGVGFASGLSMSGIPRAEIPLALFFFNVGVEAGQLLFVLVSLAAAQSIRTLELDRPQWVTRVPAYTVGSLGAFWTIQRVMILIAPWAMN